MANKKPKVGLALGSGGVRGLSQIGAIKVLEKNNIPIDFISGSSIGALIGGLYSATKDISKIEKLALGIDWKKILSLLFDPGLRQGILRGEKIKEKVETYIGKTRFENLKIPLAIATTDLKTGKPVIFRKGNVGEAIRASISIPLTFQPIIYKNKLLADGGLSMPVPVEPLLKMGANFVIAINIDNEGLVNNRNKNLSFYRIADTSINIMRYHLSLLEAEKADVIISPNVGAKGWNYFLHPQEIILAGEKAVQQSIPIIKKKLKSFDISTK